MAQTDLNLPVSCPLKVNVRETNSKRLVLSILGNGTQLLKWDDTFLKGGRQVKLIIADDDTLISDSLKIFIEMGNEIEVIGTAKDGDEVIKLCEQDAPDVILMDVRMPNKNGVEATRIIKQRWPKNNIVMLTTFNDSELIKEALFSGADGYLLKSTPADGIVERIKAIGKGAVVFDSKVLENIYTAASPYNTQNTYREALTQREVEIVYLVAQGHYYKEIAETVHLSEGSVRNIISEILSKLELRDRTQLAVYYWKMKK
jgi:two-component system, NarL family, response regulator LiaR